MGFMHIDNLYRDKTILMFRECYAAEKLHGCLDAESVLQTRDGKKTIKEICETHYKGMVLSFDFDKNKNIFAKVTGHSIGDETEDWYEITLEDGKKIIATSNHRFWLPELRCWRKLSDLSIGNVLEND